MTTGQLGFLDIAKAPDLPGLYAWYGGLSLYAADFRDEIVAGQNEGPRRLRQSLARHTVRFDPRPRKLVSRSEFGGRWRGELTDAGRQSIRKIVLNPTSSENGVAAALNIAMRSETLRRELVSILQAAQPILSAPLYIGVTNSLKRRLREHADLYNELRDAIANDPEQLGELKNATEARRTEFAHRAVAAEFEPENLTVYIKPYKSNLPTNEVDSLLRSAEWLLNRWHRPILGRE